MEIEAKREIVSILMSKGTLVNRETLGQLDAIQNINSFKSLLLQESGAINLQELIKKSQETKKEDPLPPIGTRGNVSVTFSYKAEPKKRDVQDFVSYFAARYNALKAILQNRKELQSPTSINRLNQKREKEQIAIIGLISDKQETKTGKIMLTAEDPTGKIKIVVSPNTDAYAMAKETSLDEVVGIVGTSGGEIIFASNIVLPDIPLYTEVKKSPDEAYALFMGDFHFGSKVFLTEAFEKFMSWIRGEQGSEDQKDIASKIKYLFMVGDIVEGVGIYPDQDQDLTITDIYDQYKEFSNYLKRIPQHIQIIICPGNHDAMRLSEPQPPLYKDFAEAVWNLPNVYMTSNPAQINIHASKDFPGFDVLLYHGFSFTHYADSVESIRSKGGQERVDLIMQYLLQRRHLAPTHTSTLYLPDAQKDNLVIDKIPDFFVTGHIHRVSASNYKSVTMLSCSCWLEKTEYQEKVGLHPQPGRAILVNLQTRKAKILKFYDDPEEKQEKT